MRNRRHAFSLLEVMVAIAILGTTLAAMRFKDGQAVELPY